MSKNEPSGLVLLLGGPFALMLAVACVDPRCPGGYTKMGDTCYRNKKDAASDDEHDLDADASALSGIDASHQPDTTSDVDRIEPSDRADEGGGATGADAGAPVEPSTTRRRQAS